MIVPVLCTICLVEIEKIEVKREEAYPLYSLCEKCKGRGIRSVK